MMLSSTYVRAVGGVEVYAVRFDDRSLLFAPRVIFGATAVHVGLAHGRSRKGTVPSAEDCYRAVRDFVAGLK